MKTETDIPGQVASAAQQMHDAADKLHALLPLVGAVQCRALLQALEHARRGADDLQQFAADLAADERDAMRARILAATTRAELDAIAADLAGLACVDLEDADGDTATTLEQARAALLADLADEDAGSMAEELADKAARRATARAGA